jgi:uncharacterized protein YcnI
LPAPLNRKWRGFVLAVLVAGLLAAVVVPFAGAHAVVLPAASRPADFQQYTLTVPTERDDASTVEIDLKVPAGIGFLLAQNAPGWETKVIRRNERIDEIRWIGGEIAPDHYATFRMIARNPVQEGVLVWRVLQKYDSGEVVRWIGPPDSDEPAARTTISEQAVPVDTLDVQSGKTTSPTAAAPADSGGGGGRDGLTLAIAIVAAVLAAIGLGFAVAAWHRGRTRSAAV